MAAAAVMARLAVPEMLKHKYDKGLATGVCASGGTLDALIPPSIAFVIYGIFAEVSIVKLLLAGILPGILTATVYMIMIMGRAWLDPIACARRSCSTIARRSGASAGLRWREIWPIVVLILGVIGGLYAGVVTPTEGGAAGALLAVVIGMVQRKLSWDGLRRQLQGRDIGTTSQLFFVGIGAIIYTKFLALAGTAEMFTQLIGSWALDPLLLVIAVSLIYIVLGTFHRPAGDDPAHDPGVRADVRGAEARSRLVRRAGGEVHRHQPADAAGRLQHLRGRERHQQFDPAEDDLPRLLLVPGRGGGHHGAADRLPADLAVAAELDEMSKAVALLAPLRSAACARPAQRRAPAAALSARRC